MGDALDLLRRFRNDFEFYAPRALKIRTKSGQILPFILNEAQRFTHAALEKQRAETGRVRAIILKGRQQGISTYTAGRFYHRVSGAFGLRVYVVAHEQAASDNLFELVDRYHEHCPDELRPHTGAANAKELFFDHLDSGYKVATAGSKNTGRSATAQLAHLSEFAFWDNADVIMAGLGQTIPNEPGTEIIIESTANGPGNKFHSMWQAAESGLSDYIAIFIPWFWQTEYRKQVPAGFSLTEEEHEYMEAHGLDMQQMVWRRSKIIDDFGGDEAWFRQEYPATAAEAFVAVGVESYIPGHLVLASRKRKPEPEAFGPLIIGVDPARFGDDSTAIIRRRGRKAYKLEREKKQDTMAIAGKIAVIIRDEKPRKVFIDVGGLGAGVYDRLVELGFDRIVQAVNFGGKATEEERFGNKRAEMWGLMKEWLADEPNQIPDDDSLHADITGPQYKYDSNGRLLLEKKEDMKKRGLRSPDAGDALALTFAFPVAADDEEIPKWRQALRQRAKQGGSAQSA